MTDPWQLYITALGADWQLIDSFDSLAAATTQIRGMED